MWSPAGPERDRWLADFEDTDGFTPVLREPPAQSRAEEVVD
jgi:hypothetical protein